MKILLVLFSIFGCYLACDQFVLDIILVLDASGSIGLSNYNTAKDALIKMVNNLNIGPTKVRVGVINYSSTVQMVKSLIATDQDKQTIINSIRNMAYLNSGTATGDALNMANALFSSYPRPLAPRVAVVFTDGYSNSGRDVIPEATKLKNSQVTIYSVGITSGINMNELRDMASVPASKYVRTVSDYQQLMNAINEITMTTCDVPAFIIPNQPYTINSEKNEVKNIQLDLSKLRLKSNWVEISITNIIGQTIVEFNNITFLMQNNKYDNNESAPVYESQIVEAIEKIDLNGYKSIEYYIPVPTNAIAMYYKYISLQLTNKYETVIRKFL